MSPALREMAMVESVESSNRIEGVTVAPDRLRPLVLGTSRPKDRSEEEVQGYRDALQRIHGGAADLPVTPETLRDLHRTIQEGAGDAGQWKAVDNDIIEFRTGEAPRVRFRTLTVKKVPKAVEEMCLLYRHALDQEHVPALVATACLVLDFLCIHPFRDGNGRVSLSDLSGTIAAGSVVTVLDPSGATVLTGTLATSSGHHCD